MTKLNKRHFIIILFLYVVSFMNDTGDAPMMMVQ